MAVLTPKSGIEKRKSSKKKRNKYYQLKKKFGSPSKKSYLVHVMSEKIIPGIYTLIPLPLHIYLMKKNSHLSLDFREVYYL